MARRGTWVGIGGTIWCPCPMVLKIMPETLGKMKIMLDITEHKQVQANIEVENEAVKQLLLSNADTLKNAITQSGIQLGGFNISLSGSEQRMKRELENSMKKSLQRVKWRVRHLLK